MLVNFLVHVYLIKFAGLDDARVSDMIALEYQIKLLIFLLSLFGKKQTSQFDFLGCSCSLIITTTTHQFLWMKNLHDSDMLQ